MTPHRTQPAQESTAFLSTSFLLLLLSSLFLFLNSIAPHSHASLPLFLDPIPFPLHPCSHRPLYLFPPLAQSFSTPDSPPVLAARVVRAMTS